MSFRRLRWVLVVVASATAAIVAVPSVRHPILRAAGWALVVNESVAPADIIVISLDSGGAGALEAADLVQRGIATRVAVFSDPPSGAGNEFIRRGPGAHPLTCARRRRPQISAAPPRRASAWDVRLAGAP